MLETRGYAVKTAHNDEEGVAALIHGGIDLILSCYPGVIGEVKAMGLLLPTIFLAGHAQPGSVETDTVLEKGSQSPVEVLASIRPLLNQFKIKRQQ